MSKLTIQHIYVSAGEKQVVSDVSFVVNSGEVSLLVGPNGSGKSTLANALMGHPHYTVTAGSVCVDEEDVTALSPDKKAQKGLFLSLQHIPKIGGINLATFLHKVYTVRTGEQVDVLEYYLRLRELAQKLGIREDLLDRPLTEGLSGGERKLSEVLQLATIRPRFALLDEIDSGVDVDALKKVFGAIATLASEGIGFLIISHHPALLEHLEPTAVHLMAQGKLVRTAGRELLEEIVRDGYCKVIECPMVEGCETRNP